MKSLIIKILKIFLLLLLIALVLMLIFGLVLWIGWPLWVGGFFVLGLLGVLLGIVFVRKLLARRNEQNFVQQIIAQDESRIQSLSTSEQSSSRELQERWKTSIEALRKSHLKKFGNPLYVLPWYMMIGESGSGKTTAIRGADLSSPFAEVNRASGISGTRNCDWWFFEQAIVLDTAGRYAIPVDQGRDSDEWQQFLSLLVKFRKREPLNGLVVTVPADQLMENNRTKLEGDAKSIRQRINELMRVLGAKFPVYVMVTKCDLIQGSVKFCDRLDAATLQQAMGRLNHPVVADNLAFGEQTMESMAERLKELRLLILNQAGVQGSGGDPSLLMFPEEFQKLEPGLSTFMRGAFQENPYQETPILRGLYFSSGRQEGTPYSHFLSAMGLIGAQDVLPGTNRGLFLHDFFSRILPADRGLFAPTQRTLEWSRLTKSLGLTAWVAVVIAMCGLLSFSFVNNLKALRDISNQFAQPPVFQGELTTDVLTLDRFRQAINRIEKKNTNWWIPRLGLPESSRVEASLKQRYCNIFKTDFLKPFDQRLAARITAFSAETPADVLGQHAMHLVRRINLLRASMDGDGLDALKKLPPIPYTSPLVGTPILDEISAKLSELYRYYLVWQRPEAVLNDELKDQQAWLKHILTLNGVNLNWVAAWVNVSGEVPGVHMSDYWRGLVKEDEGAFVAPAFTIKGKAAIDTYLGEMEKALSEPLSIGSQKQAFMQWYPQAKINAWSVFVEDFPSVPRRLKSREKWQQAGALLPLENGPYLALFDTLATELAAVKSGDNLPDWAELALRLKLARLQAGIDSKGGKTAAATNFLQKASEKVSDTIHGNASSAGKDADSDAGFRFEDRQSAARAFSQYRTALGELAVMTDSRKIAFKLASELYSEDPADGASPFFKARSARKELQTFLGREKTSAQLFWDLVNGPIWFYHEYAVREAQCQLQSIWEKDVYLEVQGVPQGANLNDLTMGSDGVALKFLKGPASPFIDRSPRKGYYAKRVDNRAIAFNNAFLTFLTRGASAAKPVASAFNVTIRAYPTDANNDAAIKPHGTTLEVQCGNAQDKLVNLHFPVKKTFNWSPRDCGDVVFTIEIGSLVLTRVYSGEMGFPKFLKDFPSGQHTFRPSDFPEAEAELKRMGIRTITPRYQFSGQQSVIGLLTASPGRIPRVIVSCWGD